MLLWNVFLLCSSKWSHCTCVRSISILICVSMFHCCKICDCFKSFYIVSKYIYMHTFNLKFKIKILVYTQGFIFVEIICEKIILIKISQFGVWTICYKKTITINLEKFILCCNLCYMLLKYVCLLWVHVK